VKLQKQIEVAVNGYNQMSQYAHMRPENPNWELRLVENPIQDPRQFTALPEGGDPIAQLQRGPAASPRTGGLRQFRKEDQNPNQLEAARRRRPAPAIATSTVIDPLAIDGGADRQAPPLAPHASPPGSSQQPPPRSRPVTTFADFEAQHAEDDGGEAARSMLKGAALPPRVAQMRAAAEKKAQAAAAAAAAAAASGAVIDE